MVRRIAGGAALVAAVLSVSLWAQTGWGTLRIGSNDARVVEFVAGGTPFFRLGSTGELLPLNGGAMAASSGDIPFSAGNFTTGDAQTWTVEEADQQFFSYACAGKLCTFSFSFFNTTVSGATATLTVALPATLTPAQTVNTAVGARNAATAQHSRAFTLADTAAISFQAIDGTNWGAATNTTTIRGQIVVPIE